MNSEKVWAGIPEYSSVGLSSASWIEGNRAEKSRHAYKRDGLHSAQKHTERQDWLAGFIDQSWRKHFFPTANPAKLVLPC